MKNTFRMLILFSMIFPSLSAGAQDKYSLFFNYKEGETYRYKDVYTYDLVQEINGQEMKVTGSNNSILKFSTESVAPDGNITFICAYEEIKTVMKNAMFDTTLDQKDLVGKRGRLIIDKYGKEIKKEVIDTVQSGNGLGGGMAALYTANFLRLPDHPVSIGEKWVIDNTDTTKVGEGYTITTAHNEYTLLQSEEKDGHHCLNIAFTSKTETTGKIFQMGMELFVEGNGDVQGAIWFDPKSGIMVAKETTTTQDMTYAVTGQMKMTIPSTQKVQMSYKLLE